MKITSLKVWKMNLGNRKPYTIAFKTVNDVDCIFVRITLENGLYGVGAANPSWEVVGESLEDTQKTLSEENLQFLIGRDIRDFYGILNDIQFRFPNTPAARAALDIAMHDVFAKFLEVPLSRFLGQKIKSMATSVTIGIKNAEETLLEAAEYYGQGFRYLKVKTGRHLEEDIERIRKLRECYGQKIHIRVDANQGYALAELKEFYSVTKALNIELIEQPLPAKDVACMKSLPEEIKNAIAADESLLSPQDAFNLAIPPKACGIFNIKLMKCGGIYPARQIGKIAELTGMHLMWGCNDESAVSISAALHTAFSFSHTRFLDLDGSLDLLVDAVSGGFRMENGIMSVSEKAGLGVELME